MNVANLHPELHNRVPFRLSETLLVPDDSGCYALVSIYQDVIYIGRSSNLNQRMKQHLDTPRVTQVTSVGLVNWFYFDFWAPHEICFIEGQLLFNFKATEGSWPPLNRSGP